MRHFELSRERGVTTAAWRTPRRRIALYAALAAALTAGTAYAIIHVYPRFTLRTALMETYLVFACLSCWAMVLALHLQRTRVSFDAERLRISYEPIPWPPRKEVEIAQLRGFHLSAPPFVSARCVCAITTRGHVPLTTLLAEDHGLALQQLLERQCLAEPPLDSV